MDKVNQVHLLPHNHGIGRGAELLCEWTSVEAAFSGSMIWIFNGEEETQISLTSLLRLAIDRDIITLYSPVFVISNNWFNGAWTSKLCPADKVSAETWKRGAAKTSFCQPQSLTQRFRPNP
jgi:hypothetical protein